MTGHLVRRVVGSALTGLALVFALFVLMDLTPGDPARRIAGDLATETQLAAIRAELGLNQPLFTRFAEWLGAAVQGDLGTSMITGEPVLDRLLRALPVTLSLVATSFLLAVVVGGVLAMLAVRRPGGWADRLTTVLSALAVAVPPFWLGLVLVLVFSVQLELLPATGYAPIEEGIGPWLARLVLPAIALAAVPLAETAPQLRSGLLECLDTDYAFAARARGIPHATLITRHALKNALAPVVSISGYRVVQLIGGAVVIETVFAMNGVGTLTVDSVLSGDLPVVIGVTAAALLAATIVNGLVDLSYGVLNPKVRTP